MGWLLDTDYDAATTPPGLRTQDLPLICEQVCRAINERRYAKGTALTEFYYVDSLTGASKKNYPTVADFESGGCLIHGDAFKTIMQTGMTLIASPGIWYTDTTFANRYGVDATPSIATTVSATLPAAANASKGVLWAPNWMYITRGLNLMTYCETPAPVTTHMMVDWDGSSGGLGGSIGASGAAAWAAIPWMGVMTYQEYGQQPFRDRSVGFNGVSPYLAFGGFTCISPLVLDATNGGILAGCPVAVRAGVSSVGSGSPVPKLKLNGVDTGLTSTTGGPRTVIVAATGSNVEWQLTYNEGAYDYPGENTYAAVDINGYYAPDVLSDISSLLTDQT